MGDTTPFKKNHYLVFYDGDCGFCTASIGLLQRLDLFKRLKCADFRRPIRQGKAMIKRLEDDMLLIAPNRRQYWGFYAWRKIAALLPALWIFVPFAYLPFAGVVGAWVYAFVSKRRFYIGSLFHLGCKSCKSK